MKARSGGRHFTRAKDLGEGGIRVFGGAGIGSTPRRRGARAHSSDRRTPSDSRALPCSDSASTEGSGFGGEHAGRFGGLPAREAGGSHHLRRGLGRDRRSRRAAETEARIGRASPRDGLESRPRGRKFGPRSNDDRASRGLRRASRMDDLKPNFGGSALDRGCRTSAVSSILGTRAIALSAGIGFANACMNVLLMSVP